MLVFSRGFVGFLGEKLKNTMRTKTAVKIEKYVFLIGDEISHMFMQLVFGEFSQPGCLNCEF